MNQRRFRYRHLIRGKRIDPKPNPGVRQTDNEPDVYELDGVENGTATIEEIDAMVRAGHLGPRDLADLGHGWQSLQDCEEFEEACRPALRREQFSLMAKCTGVILLGVLWALTRTMRHW